MRGLSQHTVRNISAVVAIVVITIAGCARDSTEALPPDATAAKPNNDVPAKTEPKPAEPQLFRWQFAPNTTYRWSQELTTTLEAPRGDRLLKGGLKVTIDFDVHSVHSKEAAGDLAELQFSIVRVRSKSDLPDLEFAYDSADSTPVDEDDFIAAMMSEMYQKLLKLKMTGHVNHRGIVEKLDVDPELKKQFEQSQALAATAVLLEPAGLNSIFFGGLIPVPEEPIAVGHEWSETFVSPAATAFGTFKMTFTPSYSGPVEVDARSREKFDVDVAMEFDKPLTTLVKLGEQTSEGALYFNQEMGAFERSEWMIDSEIIFNEGEAKGRMGLGMKSTFRTKTAADDLNTRPEIEPEDED